MHDILVQFGIPSWTFFMKFIFLETGEKKTGCKETIDEDGYCATLRHFDACGPEGNSRNNKTRHIQRKMRREIQCITDENPGKKIKQIVSDGMHKIKEFRNESGALIAGSMATAGVKRKRESDAAIYVKKIHNKGVNMNDIPEDLLTMDCQYPRKCLRVLSLGSSLVHRNGHNFNQTFESFSDTGTYQTQRAERQLVHVKDKIIIWALPEDLESLNNSQCRIHIDGTFRPASYLPGYKESGTYHGRISF